jgi:hypothetical protein
MMIDSKSMQKIDAAALAGYRGERMPETEDAIIVAAWRCGRSQAIDKGLIPAEPIPTPQSIKTTTDQTIRLNYQRLPDCY